MMHLKALPRNRRPDGPQTWTVRDIDTESKWNDWVETVELHIHSLFSHAADHDRKCPEKDGRQQRDCISCEA